MNLTLFFLDLEQIMRNILVAALLVFIVVFMAGVLFGWAYGLFLGFVILLAISFINLVNSRGGER